MPRFRTASGNWVKLVSWRFDDRVSPAPPIEPFDLLDVTIEQPFQYDVRRDWNALVYVLSGAVAMTAGSDRRAVHPAEAVGASGVIRIDPEGAAHILVLSGRDPREPTISRGPFVMNTGAELDAARDHYQRGAMDSLSPTTSRR